MEKRIVRTPIYMREKPSKIASIANGVNSEELTERWIEIKLWGYPDLVNEFHDRVLPALAEVRNERRERERRERIATRHVGINLSALASAVVGQVEGNTAVIPPQSSQTAHFDDRPGRSGLRRADVQQDSPTQQDDRPPPSAEPSLPTASTITEPTPGNHHFPLKVPGRGEGSILSNEIVEVTSTSESEDERSRTAQRKGKARERL